MNYCKSHMSTVSLVTGREAWSRADTIQYLSKYVSPVPGLPGLHITVKSVIVHDSHTHTRTHNVHNNNMIDSTMCSFSAALMLSGQSIISLMGMWSATLMTLC